jgi:aldehyde dehydrogenase (NAD+)
VLQYIKKGQDEGAKLLIGGKRWGDRGYFIEPTVFADATDDMSIVKEEIFGPVMVILKFKDANEAIHRANNSIYGLTGGVMTNDINKALAVAKRIRSGTVWINTWNHFDPAFPFGGFKQSGIGRELGPYGLKNYVELKTVCISLERASNILDQPFYIGG